MIKVGILGTSGYVAKELIRLLLGHPDCSIECLVSHSSGKGKDINDIFKEFRKVLSRRTTDDISALKNCDVVITSKPDSDSLRDIPDLIKLGLRVIDMSAAYRFNDPNEYEKIYKREHTSPELLEKSIYGLTELHRHEIKDAQLIANPGCFPISAILSCAPLIKNHLIDPEDIIVDSYSGISGAGAHPEDPYNYLFCELDGNIVPYKVCEHRHTGEMEQELTLLAQSKTLITFVPHLSPMKRGIMSTLYLKLRKPYPSLKELIVLYSTFYEDEFFVRIMEQGEVSTIRNIAGTNFCDISIFTNGTYRVVILSAIDNLVKGAAGQAIQNLNVMFGLNETTGLVGINSDGNAWLPSDITIAKLIKLPNE